MKAYLKKAYKACHTFLKHIRERDIVHKLNIAYKTMWNLLLIIIVIGLMAAFFSVGVGAGYFASLVKDEKPLSPHQIEQSIYNYEVTTQVYFANDKLLGNLQSELERKEITLDEVSPIAVNALLATEDTYFYEHWGIVPKSLIRATIQEITSSSVQTGGSTLTQQLVKNQLLTSEVSFKRKAKEILLAMRLERFFKKDEILEAYLNIVSFGRNSSGQNVAGIESAAQGIFGVPAKDLSLPQAAFIAGLPKNPYSYTPFNNDGTVKESIEKGIQRMKTVLKRMRAAGMINEEEYEQALAYDIKNNLAKPKSIPQQDYPYVHYEVERRATEVLAKTFADKDELDSEQLALHYQLYGNLQFESHFLKKPIEDVAKSQKVNIEDVKRDYELFSEYIKNADDLIRRKGYQIYTTIDKDIYDAMEKSKNGVLNNANYFQAAKKKLTPDQQTGEKTEKNFPMQVGAILIENQTGRILSFIGGRHYEESQLNYATQAYRSNGSTMKPLLDYAPAMELGKLQPGMMLMDSPLTGVKDWTPKNYGGTHRGLVTVREALKDSINLPAARAFLLMEPYEATAYLEKMGFTSLIHGADRYNNAMSLGGLTRGVTVEENTNAFTTFANGGQFIDAYLIEKIIGHDGEVVYQHETIPNDVFSPQTAYLTLDMMRDVLYDGGTANRVPNYLNFRADWAGKTGTSQDWHDSWFVGLNPNVTLGVWTGYEQPMSLDRSNYAHRTQRLWALLINAAYGVNKDLIAPKERFSMPSGIVKRTICGISGKLASKACEQAGLVRTDLFNAKFAPDEEDDALESIRYVILNGINYLAHDSTPTEFTKKGLTLDLERLQDETFTGQDGMAMKEAEENGKIPGPVTNVTINNQFIIWSKHSENDIVGYRIYQVEKDDHTLVGNVASFADTRSFKLPGDGSYYVTAVDVIGNESPPSNVVLFDP